MANKLKVFFVCLGAAPLFNGADAASIGGMELRSWLFATGLKKYTENEVSFVVRDGPNADASSLDGISVIPFKASLSKFSRLLFKRVRDGLQDGLMSSFFFLFDRYWKKFLEKVLLKNNLFSSRVLASINADEGDVYLVFGVNWVSDKIIKSAKKLNKKSVLFLASNEDLSEQYKPNSSGTNAYGDSLDVCYSALINADVIISQTDTQQKLLLQRFNRTSYLIRNPVIFNKVESVTSVKDRNYVLWVGRSDNFHKRPDLLLKLAEACPHIQFLMILNIYDQDIYRKICTSVTKNVQIIEKVPYRDMAKYFEGARIFVSTSSSKYEGFPNTYLQAGLSGAPIVSLEVDPDGYLKKNDCGFIAGGDFDLFISGIKALWAEDMLVEKYAKSHLSYLRKLHNHVDRVMELDRTLSTI